MKTEYIVFVLFFVSLVSVAAAGVGLIEPLAPADHLIDAPPNIESGFTWFNTLENLFWWVLDVVWFMIQLITFQVPGVPFMVNLLIVFPMMAGFLYIMIRLIKPVGGS